MNCHIDFYATYYVANWADPSQVMPFIPASKASISIAGITITITCNIARCLRQAAISPALEKHIMTTNVWNKRILRSIDWDTQAKALSTLKYTQELFAIKWAHNLLPTRRHMQRIGKAESDLCPSCLQTIKTAPHIFTCPQQLPWQAIFTNSLQKLLDKMHTQPDLQHILLTGIQGALNTADLTCNIPCPLPIAKPALCSSSIPRTRSAAPSSSWPVQPSLAPDPATPHQ
jgi:hypothetical protein